MFAHLHAHTEYSQRDGYGKIKDIVNRVIENDQKYYAITDHGNTNGWPALFKEAKGNDKILPIYGVEGYVCNDMNIKGVTDKEKMGIIRGQPKGKHRDLTKVFMEEHERNKRAHIVLLAKNEDGIKEIYKAVSISNEIGFYYRPRFDFKLLSELHNVFILSACAGGIISYHIGRKDIGSAYIEAERYKKLFGKNFYMELMAIDWDVQTKVNYKLVKIALNLKIPFVITNDCHYVSEEDYEIHDCLLAIQSSYRGKPIRLSDTKNRMHYEMKDLFIKTEKQMFKSFNKRNPLLTKLTRLGLDNTIEIAEQCHHKIITGFKIMPDLKIDHVDSIIDSKRWYNNSEQKEKDYILWKVKEGWRRKISGKIPKNLYPVYKKRLRYELSQIFKGFTKYFIVVQRLMEWVDSKGIERGPARGSSAASLVCYLLNITKAVDPVKYDLLFSRFIDPNRTDNPDIDMDFQDDRRKEIFKYLIETYGKNNVALLGNNTFFKGKSALRDVARLLGISQSEVSQVTELLMGRSSADSRTSFTIMDSFNEFPKCKEFKEKHPKLIDYAIKLEGRIKGLGTHAAGVVIGDGDLRKYMSFRYDKKYGNFIPIANIDKRDCDDIGLLKLDVLGLNTLTIINEIRKMVKERYDD
jgi:DNA polymerase-3 subunit alpha